MEASSWIWGIFSIISSVVDMEIMAVVAGWDKAGYNGKNDYFTGRFIKKEKKQAIRQQNCRYEIPEWIKSINLSKLVWLK